MAAVATAATASIGDSGSPDSTGAAGCAGAILIALVVETDFEGSGFCICTVACGSFGVTELAGTFAVSFFASVFNGAGAIGATLAAGATDEAGGTAADGGLGGAGGAAGAGTPGDEGGRGGATGGTAADGGLGRFDDGGTAGGLGALGVDGGSGDAEGGTAGLGGRFSITVSLGFAATGLLSLREGRTMRTVSFLGSAIMVCEFEMVIIGARGGKFNPNFGQYSAGAFRIFFCFALAVHGIRA